MPLHMPLPHVLPTPHPPACAPLGCAVTRWAATTAKALLASLSLLALPAHAGTGWRQLPGSGDDGPVTVYYPTAAADQPVRQGWQELPLAPDAPAQAGNGRLVVISHGSGGAPWVHGDLARALVAAGFVVAFPQHQGDHWRDTRWRGPQSWARRPAEVSRAIDAVARDAGLAPLLKLERVGLYGMSAGGHTALSLAGGRWSPARFAQHCQAHLADDFQTCVGLATSLTGGWADGLKQGVARQVLRWTFRDTQWQTHEEPRIAAVAAAVPLAADFDLASLATPRVPLALLTAGQDRWLVPRFHAQALLQVCRGCEHLADLPSAGHGAYLSPLPPGLSGLEGEMLNDPPGFDRSALPAIDARVVDYFRRHLLVS
jgi:predicted dienelactone hydrolase